MSVRLSFELLELWTLGACRTHACTAQQIIILFLYIKWGRSTVRTRSLASAALRKSSDGSITPPHRRCCRHRRHCHQCCCHFRCRRHTQTHTPWHSEAAILQCCIVHLSLTEGLMGRLSQTMPPEFFTTHQLTSTHINPPLALWSNGVESWAWSCSTGGGSSAAVAARSLSS